MLQVLLCLSCLPVSLQGCMCRPSMKMLQHLRMHGISTSPCNTALLPRARRWKSSVLTAHLLEKAGTIVGVRAVAILAGVREDFKQQCRIGRSQVQVPEAWVDKLLPGIFTLQQQQLRTQAQQV
jgi:hypothetical protein